MIRRPPRSTLFPTRRSSDLLQAVAAKRLQVLGAVAACEQTGVHARVKRFDAAVHDLREPGQVRHRPRVDRRVGKRLQRAAGREDLEAEPAEAAREPCESCLVANRQQSSWQSSPPSTVSLLGANGTRPRALADGAFLQ